MTPDKLAKIKALAEDPRGDPATREIARRAYARYAKEESFTCPSCGAVSHNHNDIRERYCGACHQFKDVPPWTPHNEQHPGLKTGAEYDKFRFMELGSWRKSVNGNPWIITKHKGVGYRFVLFKYKKSPTWGWMRVNTISEHTEWSGRFATIAEAHTDAWKALQMI